jgi:hypothetical protein
MQYTEFLLTVTSVLAGLAMWFMKRTIDQQDKRIDLLEKGQIEIKTDYLHKSEFKDFKLELREMFQEIKQDIRDLKR